MTTPGRDELALYVMGEHDGDTAALEAALAGDGADATAARAIVADEARLEGLLREAGAAATFCPGCRDLALAARCDACGAALRPGGYQVERVLVANAHGRMYVARDADGRRVALKELAFVQAPSAAVIAAFEREAKFLRALAHPAIPRFVASFEEGVGVHARYYLAQELVDGPSLAALLDDHWFTEAETKDVAAQVLRVLVYLQGLSPRVIHRDIKPANLLRRADGSIAVVDFGAAHVQGTTAGSTSIGTFGYMPIEQLAGEVGPTTDPFALGASLLHLLSRQEPWRIVQARAFDAINVSPALRDFLGRLVAPEPADRFPDAAAALAALTALDAGVAVAGADDQPATALAARRKPATAASTAAPPRPRRDAWRTILHAAATLALLGVGGGAFAVARHHTRARTAPDAPARAGTPVAAAAEAGGAAPAPGDPAAVSTTLPRGPDVDLDFKAVPVRDLVLVLGQRCGLNVIVPDYIRATASLKLERVPCKQALQVLLEPRALWYQYRSDANLLRITTNSQATSERAERRRSLDPLPVGPPMDVDLVDAPIADVLQLFASAAHINLVLPDLPLANRVTIRGRQMAWAPTLVSLLQAHGLWYRYRVDGSILLVVEDADSDVPANASWSPSGRTWSASP